MMSNLLNIDENKGFLNEKQIKFLEELGDLTKKHGVFVAGCIECREYGKTCLKMLGADEKDFQYDVNDFN